MKYTALNPLTMKMEIWIKLAVMALLFEASTPLAAGQSYRDGRPAATLRMVAKDHGIVLRYGDGPGKCDYLGARDVWVFEDKGTYYMHYDAPEGSSTSHMKRHVGMAWLELPLSAPDPSLAAPASNR